MSDDRQREALHDALTAELLTAAAEHEWTDGLSQTAAELLAVELIHRGNVVHLPTLADTEGPWKATSPEANGWHYVWREGHNGATGPFSDKRTARLVAGLLNRMEAQK